MKIVPLRVGADLDGCGFMFTDAFRRHRVAHHNDTADKLGPVHRWEFYEDWGMSLDQFLSCLNGCCATSGVFADGPPIAGFVEALAGLKKDGHTIHIVTHRPPLAIASTVDWLAAAPVAYNALTFASDKTVANVDVMIEDSVDNFVAVEKAGVVAYLFDQPWNRHHDTPMRVHSWSEFHGAVTLLALSRAKKAA